MEKTFYKGKLNQRNKRQEPRNKFRSRNSKVRISRIFAPQGASRLRCFRESSLQASENSLRDRIDILRSRVNLLEGKDRALMKMYLDNGEAFSQMARVAGVNEANVARRIYKITRRLLDGQYISVLRNRGFFKKPETAIARDYFVKGLSMRNIARAHKVTFYHV